MVVLGRYQRGFSIIILAGIALTAITLNACQKAGPVSSPQTASADSLPSPGPSPVQPAATPQASATPSVAPAASAQRGPNENAPDLKVSAPATPSQQIDETLRGPTPQTGTGTGIGSGSGLGPGVGGGSGYNPNRIYLDPNKIDYNRVFDRREVEYRPRVLSKPEPVYTATARQKQIIGTVVLRALFHANGQVTDISVVNGLSDGLSEAAIDAARRIKFTPAKLNGRAVSMYMEVHYNFNLF